MATFKHISSKNADYGAAEQYLTFEHDEFTMKPTLDENGRLVPREDYRLATLNCGDEDFAVACMRSNLRYGKNQKREDVKSHHYIISFDPRDGTDNGLTVDKAQSLGEEFCNEHFPGHQAIVCTHPDGHNHSGNIHVHIVINSLRIEAVPLLPYMDRPADTKDGCKHRCTDAAMEYFKSEVMEMCHRENLYQIDLLHGSKNRVTEREYWAQKKGQLALDKENAAREATGQPTKPTKFETDKAKLRRTIRQALSQAGSFDEFASLLLREGVTVKESRGRLSYLTPDRTKPITARKLGDDFDKAAVLALLTQNAHRAAEQTTAIPEYPHTQKERLREEKTAKTAPADNTLQRMVDREAKRAEGKGVGYDRWASLHNLKQMAATHNFLMENELLDLDKLDAAVESSRKALSEARESLRGIEQSISDKKSLRKVVNDYRRTRPTIDAHKKLSGRKAENYRQSHEAEFIIYEAALRQLKVLAPGKKLPATSKLNTEIEALISEKNAAYNTYRTAKAEYEQLATAKRNAEQILHGTPSRQKKHEQER
ncbi:MAG: relaxase/mobilization nuclease domain-containing protein [Oscillospiraceae bacterium]